MLGDRIIKQVSGWRKQQDDGDAEDEDMVVMVLLVVEKVKQSHYRPKVPRGFQEVKVRRLRDNGPGW